MLVGLSDQHIVSDSCAAVMKEPDLSETLDAIVASEAGTTVKATFEVGRRNPRTSDESVSRHGR